MASLVSLSVEIERLSARRHAIWLGHVEPDGEEVKRLTGKLQDCFETKRTLFASAGSQAKRESKMRSARLDRDLERMIESSIKK